MVAERTSELRVVHQVDRSGASINLAVRMSHITRLWGKDLNQAGLTGLNDCAGAIDPIMRDISTRNAVFASEVQMSTRGKHDSFMIAKRSSICRLNTGCEHQSSPHLARLRLTSLTPVEATVQSVYSCGSASGRLRVGKSSKLENYLHARI
jgi:hypothetical protein